MNYKTNNPMLKPQHPCMKSSAGIYPEYRKEDDEGISINRLTNNLCYLFNVTSGDYLTYILGHGECTRNEDALKYWVLDQLDQESVSSGEVLSVLVEKLKEQLTLEAYL